MDTMVPAHRAKRFRRSRSGGNRRAWAPLRRRPSPSANSVWKSYRSSPRRERFGH